LLLMLDYLMLLVVAFAGYGGAPWWFILYGALGLTIETWVQHYRRLLEAGLVMDRKMAGLFAIAFADWMQRGLSHRCRGARL
jgi:hypothetical protein